MHAPEATAGWLRPLLAAWFSNPWAKLLSVALATIAWLYVQGEEVREERVKAQIAWTLPEDLVATEALPTAASITVRGTRAAVNKAHQAAIRLVVDVSAYAEGEHSVDLDGIVAEGLPPSVERLGVIPSAVPFTLDRLAVHSVRIQVVLVGDPAPGYTIAGTESDPNVIEVRGPRDAVSALREVPTRPIDVSGLTEDVEREVPLDLPRAVELASDSTIRVRLTVRSQTEQRRYEGVPVFIREGPTGGAASWRVQPQRLSVLLEGPTSRLQALDAEQIAAFVHLPDSADADHYDVWFGPSGGARIEVLHGGGDGVTAIATTPPSVGIDRL